MEAFNEEVTAEAATNGEEVKEIDITNDKMKDGRKIRIFLYEI